MEAQEVKSNGGGTVEVPEDVVTLIAGLKRLGDVDGIFNLTDRIKRLSYLMDEKAETGGGDASSEIIDLAYWQRFVLEEVMHIVEAQDYTIMKLQSLVRTDQEKELYFKPSRSSLRAIRSLSNLFQTDALFHCETVGVPQL
jgi:hypothetical protein